MKKLLLLALPLLVMVAALPIIGAVVVAMSSQAAARCHTDTVHLGPRDEAGTVVVSRDLGVVEGRAGGPPNAGTAATSRRDVLPALMRLRFSAAYPTLTAEQARNAVTIAQVARNLKVARRGLEVAIATAIQESKLVNLEGGDRDSGGLFQQRPSTGWGSRTQVTNPTLAATAFFGRAQHTSNPGLLDIPGWEQMAVTDAAQAVQRSDFPGAYAQWGDVAGDIAELLGGDLPDVTGSAASPVTDISSNDCADVTAGSQAPITLGTLNLLGADHTNGSKDGGRYRSYGGWQGRLSGAMSLINDAGVSIAALQEVHHSQGHALAGRYSAQWGMYPSAGGRQNRVIWDRNEWTATDQRLVAIPYFGGKDVEMPLVQLRSTTTGQAIWVWSVHNPASVRGPAARHRVEALRRQLATTTELAATGTPTVIMGDFNDGTDGQNAAHCVLTPTLTNAFGGSATPCRKPRADSRLDHIYGANLSWAGARVDNSTRTQKLSDHPLVVATTTGSTAGCAIPTDTDYTLGRVKPQLTATVNVLGPMFAIKTVGGYRASATDPHGHPAGLAADFMVPLTPAGRAQGQALATYAQQNANRLGVDYIIWYQRIWSTSRAAEGWRPMEDRGGPTENHLDHVHINVKPGARVTATGAITSTNSQHGNHDGNPANGCSEIVYPVPAAHVGNDRHNWHSQGSAWNTWHTGTDFSAPCGTPVYAAHAGTVEIDTTQGWAGPALVKVNTGPKSLSTWYAHMQQVTVSRGAQVQPGQQIGMVGDEGNSRGCHLHFEVHLENGSIYGPDDVNPSDWLTSYATPVRATKTA